MSGLKFDANNCPYIPLGELTIRLESEEPTDLVKERARTELRETPEVSAASIDELRALIKGNITIDINSYSIKLPTGLITHTHTRG